MDSHLDQIVRAAGVRLKWSALLAGLSWWLAVCLGLWLTLLVLDNLLTLPTGLRLPLAVGGAAFTIFHFFQKVMRPALRKQTPERTVMVLEQRYGIGENLLINALQFQRQKLRPEERVFADQTIALSGEFSERVRFGELWNWRVLGKWGGLTVGVAVLWAVFVVCCPRQFHASFSRYALPLADTPPPSKFTLRLTPADDVVLPEGGSLDVVLEVTTPDKKPLANPPVLVWQERAESVAPVQSAGENLPLTPRDQKFFHTFANVQSPFAFRVFAGDGYTRSVRVQVRPQPHISNPQFLVTPPAYTGRKPQPQPGPPAAVSALPGSTLQVSFRVQPAIDSAQWSQSGGPVEFQFDQAAWTARMTITNAGPYEISARMGGADGPVRLAGGNVQLLADNPPQVDFVTEDRNRVVQLGQTVTVDLAASDDYGLAEVHVAARLADKEDGGAVVKKWDFGAPPGNTVPWKEKLTFTIDPQTFDSGGTYYLEALAKDFRPGGAPSRSRPILLRVKSMSDLTLSATDSLAPAFAQLKLAAASQEKAVRLTANLKTYLSDALAKNAMGKQAKTIGGEQNNAIASARTAQELFDSQPAGKIYSTTLGPLIKTDMAGVQTELRSLADDRPADLPAQLTDLQTRQEKILAQLLHLLGQVADAHADELKSVAQGKEDKSSPALPDDKAKQLMDDLKKFEAEQERIVEKGQTLADKGPEDLTQGDRQTLGEMASEEDKWAKFFEQKVADLSQIAQQDFSDQALAKEASVLTQNLKTAAQAAAQQELQKAFTAEDGAQDAAKQLESTLAMAQGFLPKAPAPKVDQESPTAPQDAAAGAPQIPGAVQDLMGDLLNSEDKMSEDAAPAPSAMSMVNIQDAKGGVIPGPLSDMSAKGETGNQMPQDTPVGGRSEAGRSGQATGQMVGNTASDKGGKEAPTQLDSTPFEQGEVKDSAKGDQGGATGGGKGSGFGGQGLRGNPSPDANKKDLPRLADQQAKIRQKAEELALQLKKYNVPDRDLKASLDAMQQLENAARKNDALGVRQAFSQAVNNLNQAKKNVDQQAVVRREQSKLAEWQREQIRIGVQDGIPKGYEEMAGEYFRALAQDRNQSAAPK